MSRGEGSSADSPVKSVYPSNVQAELARERNRIAADRSLLSFVRSSVTLITIGFGIDRVITALSPASSHPEAWLYSLSLVLIGTGVLSLALASLDYAGEMQRLSRPDYDFTPRWSLASLTGWTIFAIGVIVFLKMGAERLL